MASAVEQARGDNSTDQRATSPGALETQALRTSQRGLFVVLPIVFLWFGAMKFTAYEAEAIHGLVANSPFIGFLTGALSPQAVSSLIGVVEITIAALLAMRFAKPALAAVGAAGAVITFGLTSSFFLTTPGVFLPDVGSMAISVVPGQFLLKDPVLFLVSLYALGDALRAARTASPGKR